MNSKEFSYLRNKLNKTQKQMAQLLGISIKAIHSYEQGWRTIPAHVERQVFFLVSNMKGAKRVGKPCWIIKRCPSELKKHCPAWEFQSVKLCWIICGTLCSGVDHKNWKEKMEVCRSCEVFTYLLKTINGE